MDSLHTWTERWSDLWSMLAAAGTLLAVAVSLWVAVREADGRKRAERRAETAEQERTALQERGDRERAEQANERRLEQARQVIAWVEHHPADPTTPRFDSTGMRRLSHEHVLRAVNHSTAPVFDVSLRIHWEHTPREVQLVERAVLPAGASLMLPLPDEHQESGGQATGFVIFRDLAGVRRRRWQNGTLNELDDNGRQIVGPHR